MERSSAIRPLLPIIGLLTLALIPFAGSIHRIIDVTFLAATLESARFHTAPIPILLHASFASMFLILGAIQFAPKQRKWHRNAGKVAIVAGLIAALAGLWMTQTYPHGPGNPELIYGFRITFGTLWALSLIAGFLAIRQRNFVAHRAFMIRAYAIGAGAGTSVLTITLFGNTFGQVAAWALNLAVAEYLIHRKRGTVGLRNGA
ncbi:MAG: DUF2306 domain-containing protein [Deltaproteobacteria bacterium]